MPNTMAHSRPCILVVDDEAAIREALTLALADRYVVRTAVFGADPLPIQVRDRAGNTLTIARNFETNPTQLTAAWAQSPKRAGSPRTATSAWATATSTPASVSRSRIRGSACAAWACGRVNASTSASTAASRRRSLSTVARCSCVV